jgi:hypothetical protein
VVLCAGIDYVAGVNKQSPIVSEFDTPEEAAAYDKWLREKVAASLADPRPPVPHDEVMARTQAIIEEAKGRADARRGGTVSTGC